MYLREYPDAVVYLYGSRSYSEGRGGDLDLLIVSQPAARQAYELSKKLRIAIKELLGDQRVDVVVSPGVRASGLTTAFVRLALLEGVRIWP
jgi:predicted nucleotidyltransferase